MAKNIRVEWRQGVNGNGSVYVFTLNPNPTRVEPALKQAEIDIPLADGVTVQNLGRARRIVQLKGILYAKTQTFEELDGLRKSLISGIGREAGQLHFVTKTTGNSTYYIGQITQEGITFSEQANPIFLEYNISILCADPEEYTFYMKTIFSNTRIS